MNKLTDIQYNDIYSMLQHQRNAMYTITAKLFGLVYKAGKAADRKTFQVMISSEFAAIFFSFGVKLNDITTRIEKARSFLQEGKYYQLNHVFAEIVFIADILRESLNDKEVFMEIVDSTGEAIERLSNTFSDYISKYLPVFNGYSSSED